MKPIAEMENVVIVDKEEYKQQAKRFKELEDENEQLQLELENRADYDEHQELKELLIEYGGHQPGCPNQYDKKYHCRCGWEKVKQALKPLPKR